VSFGVDLSEKMLERARALTQASGVTYCRADMENLTLPDASFDLVYSSLALHYLEDFTSICAAICRLLVSGGHLVFSVEHPIFTAPSHPGWRTDADGSRVWPLDSYQLEEKRLPIG
jgi:ubiquinone/menaquinone biosynthesis C-methylase UbiE